MFRNRTLSRAKMQFLISIIEKIMLGTVTYDHTDLSLTRLDFIASFDLVSTN